MASPTFPSLTPSVRSWTPGAPRFTVFASLSGHETRVLQSGTAVGQSLSMTFENITEASSLLITNHFEAVRGMFDVFDLPAAAFGGMSSYGHIKPASHKWRYADTPSVRYVSPGVASVSVSLVAVPQ